MKLNKFIFIIFSFFFFLNLSSHSITLSHYFSLKHVNKNYYIWSQKVDFPFNDLILSWNAFRPTKGQFVFYAGVKHNHWSPWDKIAQWGHNGQQTFSSGKNTFVHSKHVRFELQKRFKGKAFRIKVVAQNGASIKNLKALFVCLSNLDKFSISKPNLLLPDTYIKNVARQSQMVIKHKRAKDWCSPTSTSILVDYFVNKRYSIGKLQSNIIKFAKFSHDDCYLDIHGNWILNVAQAFVATKGKRFFRVQRLNGFNELYKLLRNKIPVAVSLRGYIRGGHHNYKNGHFITVIGWNKKRKSVICIDSAFSPSSKTLRAYNVNDFLKAWAKSKNLSYVVINRS